ncbi:hypothetical protein ACHAXN_008982 [Cyclotella atomus]
MASSPPRQPLGSISANNLTASSPKRPTRAPAAAAATSNPESSTPFLPYSPLRTIGDKVNKISQYRWGPSLRTNQEYTPSASSSTTPLQEERFFSSIEPAAAITS